MGNLCGDPIRGELSSADASSGVAFDIFKMGSQTAHTLAANEYIEIHDLKIVAAVGGDLRVFFDTDDDDALDAGEEIWRGTVAANGGLAEPFQVVHPGPLGSLPHILAPAGQVDAYFTGTIRTEGDNVGGRATYRESQVPGT